MTLGTLADITGDNAKHQLSATPGTKARWIEVSVTGSGAARIGDTSVGAARGAALTAAVSPWRFEASTGDPLDTVDLSQVFAYVPTGATLSITYGL